MRVGFYQLKVSQRGCASRLSAFTLIELLVVISIMSVLMGILMPALGGARRQARRIVGMNNQRQIVGGVNFFSCDYDDRYPYSVATTGDTVDWNWAAPLTLASFRSPPGYPHRSVSEYLSNYIEDADAMFCPNAHSKFKHLQDAWEEGDDWSNPDLPGAGIGALRGVYNFYWNYEGYLGADKPLFKGPRGPAAGGSESQLLVSCYFGYGHMASPDSYRSCEETKGASVVLERSFSASYWSYSGDIDLETFDIKLQAGYIDGHVENFSVSEAVPMRVIRHRPTSFPYEPALGPGSFYLPKNAVR